MENFRGIDVRVGGSNPSRRASSIKYLLELAELPRYRDVRANSRSRQSELTQSNYWTDLHPILESRREQRLFVIAGDVAGNPDSIAGFYDQVDGVTMIASGMGEVADENYLEVTLLDDGPNFRFVPLDPTLAATQLDNYRAMDPSSDAPVGRARTIAILLVGVLLFGGAAVGRLT